MSIFKVKRIDGIWILVDLRSKIEYPCNTFYELTQHMEHLIKS